MPGILAVGRASIGGSVVAAVAGIPAVGTLALRERVVWGCWLAAHPCHEVSLQDGAITLLSLQAQRLHRVVPADKKLVHLTLQEFPL